MSRSVQKKPCYICAKMRKPQKLHEVAYNKVTVIVCGVCHGRYIKPAEGERDDGDKTTDREMVRG